MSNMFPHPVAAPTPVPSAFLPASIDIEPPVDADAPLRAKLRLAGVALAVLVFGFGAAAAGVPIGGAVVGMGQVGVASRVKRIAHPTGGVIAQVLVANGDHVVRGQPLIRLDDRVTGSDAQLSGLSVDQLLAQRARLEAERMGASAITFPADLAGRTDPGAQQAMADERRLFAVRNAEFAGQMGQMRARIAQQQQEAVSYRAQITALQAQQKLIAPERQGVHDLWDKQLVTIDRMNQLERTAVDMDGSIASLRARIAQTGAESTETRQQMIQLGETRRSTAGAQLTQVNAALNDQQVRSISARDQHDRSVLRAPYSGTVDKLVFSAKGDVIRPAETIMEIVPDKDRMVVEATVSPADIDRVHEGQRARLRFASINAASSPELIGQVTTVAPQRTSDAENLRSWYEVRVVIDPAALRRSGGLRLRPGMPTEVYIETGSRSMLSYVTKPLADQFARAFRDH